MKLEVGKLYRTRHGKKAIILKRKYGNSDFVLDSFIFGSDTGYYFYYKEDGTYETDGDFTLVGEWEEKPKDKPKEPTLWITANDVGKLVMSRDGRRSVIIGYNPSYDSQFPIGTYMGSHMRNGRFAAAESCDNDIVEILGFPGGGR